jgi:hypothetical protein
MERVNAVTITNLCVKLYSRTAAVWDESLCCRVCGFQYFGGTCHLHLRWSMVHKDYQNGLCKVKGLPTVCHGGMEGEQRYNSNLGLTSTLDGVEGLHHASAALRSGKRPTTHCTWGWIGIRSGLGQVQKILHLLRFKAQAGQPIASDNTDWLTQPPVGFLVGMYSLGLTSSGWTEIEDEWMWEGWSLTNDQQGSCWVQNCFHKTATW